MNGETERNYKEKSFGDVFKVPNTQYEIPFFQRGYVWNKDKWNELLYEVILENICEIDIAPKRQRLLDIEKLNEDILNNGNYYFGTIYLKQKESENTQSPDTPKKYLIIDGQQRLLTIYLFLVKLYFNLQTDDNFRDKILNFKNKVFNENQKDKIYTLKSDEKDLIAIITGNSHLNPHITSNISSFNSWYNKIFRTVDSKIKYNLFLILFNSLKITEIILSRKDDEMLIFENLNDKGTPLRGDELLCNYIFQPLIKNKKDEEIEKIHKEYWLETYENIQKMDIETKGRQLREDGKYLFFLRNWFSIGENKMIGLNKAIYHSFKNKYKTTKNSFNADAANKTLQEINSYVPFFKQAIFPQNNNLDCKTDKLDFEKLNRLLIEINDLKIYTNLPFLMVTLKNLKENPEFLGELIKILRVVYVFLIRRSIAGLSTTKDNGIFPSLWNVIKDCSQKTEKIKQVLHDNSLFVADEALQDRFLSLKFYGHPLEKLLLREIDKYFCKKSLCGEYPDYSSIDTTEHILPQIFEVKWKDYLADEYKQNPQYTEIINNRIHTIGNLMLVGRGRNSSQQNDIFSKKLEGYEKNTGLSKDLIENYTDKKWNVETIEERSKKLAGIVAEIFSWNVD